MTVAPSNLWRASLPAILAAAGLCLPTVQAQTNGRPIRLSDPSGLLVTSSLNDNSNSALERLNPSPSGLKQVQEDLFQPLANSLRSVDSMQGVLTLPAAPVRPQMSRHDRELMDQRRNWAFTDLKDLYPETSPEELLGVKDSTGDGQDKLNVSLIQRYYDSLGQKSKDASKPGNDFDPTGTKQYSITNGLRALTQSFAGSDQFTKILFSGGQEAFGSDKPLNPEDSPSVIGDPQELRASQKRLADFRQMLNPSQAFTGDTGGLNATSAGDVANRAASEPYRSSINPMLGIVDPTVTALHSRVNDDPTAAMLGLPNPVKVAPPSKPAETFQQMMDPFAAGMPKPKL